jgi:arylsulfatase A-like enzyme
MALHHRNGSEKPPNIILIMMDSVRRDALSCYGAASQTSPHIDAIAARGVVFEDAVSTSSWTLPAVASIFTGQYASCHGADDGYNYLNPHHQTLAEILVRNGYQTAAFCANGNVSTFTGLDRGFQFFNDLHYPRVDLLNKLLKANAKGIRAAFGRKVKYHETVVLYREAKRWLKEKRDPHCPFFVYIHENEAHYPYQPPRWFRKKFLRLSAAQVKEINQDRELFVAGKVRMTSQELTNLRLLYYAEICYLDYRLKQFVDFLKTEGLWDDLFVIITADHGDNFGEHGLIGHGLSLYDSLLKVPLILHYPGKLSPRRVSEQVQLCDILPTVIDLADLPDKTPKLACQGKSLAELAHGANAAEGRVAFAEHAMQHLALFEAKIPDLDADFYKKYKRATRAVRVAGLKYIWSSNDDHELYDLGQDPEETRNLIDQYPDKALALQQTLAQWLASFVPDTYRGSTPEPDDVVTQRLRDLGYL